MTINHPPETMVAYPQPDGVLGDFHSVPIGTWKATASWPIRNSFIGTRMYQIEATVDGITYTGRGFGVGMSYRGRIKAGRNVRDRRTR